MECGRAPRAHQPTMSLGPQQACPGPPRCGPPLGGDALPHATTATSRHSRRLRRYEETHASSISPVLCAVLCCLSCAPSTIRNVTLRVLRSSPTAATPLHPPSPGRDDDPAGDLRRELWPPSLACFPDTAVRTSRLSAAIEQQQTQTQTARPAAAVSLWANNKLFYLPNPNKPQNPGVQLLAPAFGASRPDLLIAHRTIAHRPARFPRVERSLP